MTDLVRHGAATLCGIAIVASCSASGGDGIASSAGGNDGLGTGGIGVGGSDLDGSGGMASTGGSGFGAAPGERDSGESCASADVQATRLPTSVWLVIEQTGFMVWSSDLSTTMWTSTRTALMGPQGAVPSLENVIKFGAVFHGLLPLDGSCPGLRVIEPALGNFAALDSAYPLDPPAPGSGAFPLPPHALESVLISIQSGAAGQMDTAPVVILVKSNGGDTDCNHDFAAAQERMLELARELVDAGAKIFVMATGIGISEPSATDIEIAQIGNTGHGVFTPENDQEIASVLPEFLREQVSCEVSLNGSVEAGRECDGWVEVDDDSISCNDPNGWRLKNPQTIELVGTACENLQRTSSARIVADFPCEVFEPIK